MNDVGWLPEKILRKRLNDTADELLQYVAALMRQGVKVTDYAEFRELMKKLERLSDGTVQARVLQWEQMTIAEFSERGESASDVLVEPNMQLEDVFQVSGVQPKNMFLELRREIRREATCVKERFPVGMVLPDVWTDTVTGEILDMPWKIVDYRKVKLASGEMRLGAILLRELALPFRVQFDAKDDANPDGSNVYVGSDVGQWLNSDAERGKWHCLQHAKDAVPEYVLERDGYLRGCSKEIREAMTEVMLDVLVKGADGSMARGELKCFCFLPTPEELGMKVKTSWSRFSSEAWEYYRKYALSDPDMACSERTFLDPNGDAQRCWLRSARKERDCYVQTLTIDGSSDYSNANGLGSCVVACVVA